jgi:hypothetical protein
MLRPKVRWSPGSLILGSVLSHANRRLLSVL